MKLQEITPSMILLLVGGILAIIVQLPVINEILPLAELDVTGSDGGINLMGGYGDVESDAINGWTMIGLGGIIWWILLIVAGILCVLPAVNKFQPFLPEMEIGVPGGLPFLFAIIGGVLQIVITLLILIGDNEDADAFGLNMLDLGDFYVVGFGFYVMLIAAIVSIVGAVLLFLEESSA